MSGTRVRFEWGERALGDGGHSHRWPGKLARRSHHHLDALVRSTYEGVSEATPSQASFRTRMSGGLIRRESNRLVPQTA